MTSYYSHYQTFPESIQYPPNVPSFGMAHNQFPPDFRPFGQLKVSFDKPKANNSLGKIPSLEELSSATILNKAWNFGLGKSQCLTEVTKSKYEHGHFITTSGIIFDALIPIGPMRKNAIRRLHEVHRLYGIEETEIEIMKY